eukprot:GHVU01012004.1.p2 GENE.GHVU01012004.1~~GHVU01012004.1.p2  ORF type:complete len:109 (+),score=16.09 GHVU01012004.1:136-462(+)
MGRQTGYLHTFLTPPSTHSHIHSHAHQLRPIIEAKKSNCVGNWGNGSSEKGDAAQNENAKRRCRSAAMRILTPKKSTGNRAVNANACTDAVADRLAVATAAAAVVDYY